MAGKLIWQDRKRTIFGLPWSFTKYKLFEDRLQITTGFMSKKEEEIRLYRVLDMTLERTLGQRIFGLGTVSCKSGDKSCPTFSLSRIKRSEQIRDMLSDMVESERNRKRVASREYMSMDQVEDDDDDDMYTE